MADFFLFALSYALLIRIRSHGFMKFAERADSISTLALSSFWVMWIKTHDLALDLVQFASQPIGNLLEVFWALKFKLDCTAVH